MPRKKKHKLKHNHRYTSEKKTHPYKNVKLNKMSRALTINSEITSGHYLGYWRKVAIKKDAVRMNEIRNKMRAEHGLPPL